MRLISGQLRLSAVITKKPHTNWPFKQAPPLIIVAADQLVESAQIADHKEAVRASIENSAPEYKGP